MNKSVTSSSSKPMTSAVALNAQIKERLAGKSSK